MTAIIIYPFSSSRFMSDRETKFILSTLYSNVKVLKESLGQNQIFLNPNTWDSVWEMRKTDAKYLLYLCSDKKIEFLICFLPQALAFSSFVSIWKFLYSFGDSCLTETTKNSLQEF